jgi:uncharacterized protein (TIGR02118 family)
MVRRVALVRRKAGMSAEAFWEHYAGPHATIVAAIPGLRRMVLSRPVGAQANDWDAVGELWFDTREALDQGFADPSIVAQLAVDRPQFLGAVEAVIVEDVLSWPETNA